MIVYASTITLKDRRCIDLAIREIKSWLDYKIGSKFKPWVLIPNARTFSSRHDRLIKVTVRVAGTPIEATPFYQSIEFVHLDPETKGRSWRTEVSFEHSEEDDPRMCMVLTCEDTSVENQSRSIIPTIPSFLRRIIKKECAAPKATPGLEIPRLDRDRFADFHRYIHTDKRSHCIVLASPRDVDGKYEIDPDSLSSNLVGLGEVWLLPNRWIARDWSKFSQGRFKAIDGDILLIFPDRFGNPLVIKFSREVAAKLAYERDISFSDYVFRYVISRSNFRVSRRLVSVDESFRRNARFRFQQLKAKYVGSEENQEFFKLMEEENDSLLQDKERLEYQLLERDDEIQTLKDEVYQKEQIAATYLQRLNEKISGDQELITKINRASPRSYDEIVGLIQNLMSDRLVLHNNGAKSLAQCKYEDPLLVWRVFKAIFEELYLEFDQSLKVGDSQARLARLGAEYVPHQSDITMGRYNGYERQYNGRTYTLNRHITLGGSRDPKRCFRLYFEYCGKERRIIIFHAGKHLDNSLT